MMHSDLDTMGMFGWILLGGIAGWIAKRATGVGEARGCIFNIAVGIIGAILGGLMFSYFGEKGVTGLNPWSFFVAAVGAVAFLWIARLLGGKR